MKVYINNKKLNNGFSALGQFPLDDRSVLDSLTDIFIDESNPKACPLYNLAYLGMSINVVEGDGTEENERVVSTIILKDATPYTPGKVVTVNSANYRNYWKVEGKDLEEYLLAVIDDVVDAFNSSLNDLSTNVSSHIDASIKQLTTEYRNSFADLSTNINAHLDSSINKMTDDMNDAVDIINHKISIIDSSINNNSLFFNGDMYENKSFQMLSTHGNLKKGTSVSDLEAMTMSELLANILFEVAAPKKVADAACGISWGSSSIYKSTVDVGCDLPNNADFTTSYSSEQWNWVSSDGNTKGTPVNLNTKGAVTYYHSDTNTNSGGETSWSGTVKEGTNGYWYATIAQNENANAVDSLDSDKDSEGNFYKEPNTDTLTTSTISFVGAWRMFSNAHMVNTNAHTAWTEINDDAPDMNADNADTQTMSNIFCASASHTFYLKWGKCINVDGNKGALYVYIPNSYRVDSIIGANDNATDTYNIPMTYAQEGTTTINNGYANGTYKKYKIEAMPRYTTVEIVIKK